MCRKWRWSLGWLWVAILCLTACRAPVVEELSTPESLSQPDGETAVSTGEMRGVWVSFLELDGLLDTPEPAQAKARLDAVMDTCRAQALNTVFFHVRAHGDAYYTSRLYPAATAAEKLLQAGFDPLAYAVEAAHARGLTLHAWVNPYRIGEEESRGVGDIPRFEKSGVWYYNPAADTARALVLDGVREILDGYAVDGVHFDDYFYPSSMSGEAESFESVPAGMAVADWRCVQVDTLISGVYGLCRSRGRLFGISPAARIDDCRQKLGADVALWMRQPGYVDYICPQIYFGFEHGSSPFLQVLESWLALPRHADVQLYVGLALYKAGLAEDAYAGTGKGEWAESHDILARQLVTLRQSGVKGFILFRYAQLTDNTAAVTEEWERFLAELRREE